jgi:citrate/tricarballylate utilization protein
MREVSVSNPPLGASPCESTPAESEARRAMEVCNACRYCEGFCAVFPAMTLRREFASGDLTYLANLCHGCRGCYYACQYAPPHEFGINVPVALAELRNESYARHAWPGALSAAFERNGVVVSLAMAAGICAVFLATLLFQGFNRLVGIYADLPGQGFYSLIPYRVLVAAASVSFLFALLAMGISLVRFWHSIERNAWPFEPKPLLEALCNAATLRYLGGGGHGCNDTDASFSGARRNLHHLLAYGFLLCFAATATATLYHHLLGWSAPYPFVSLPVLLGTLGGLGLTVGSAGLLWLKMKGDRGPEAPRLLGADVALLVLLMLIAISGLLLLGLRTTNAMGITLSVHLGLVLSFFLTMPYSKFVHGLYRLAALIRFAKEQPRPRPRPRRRPETIERPHFPPPPF